MDYIGSDFGVLFLRSRRDSQQLELFISSVSSTESADLIIEAPNMALQGFPLLTTVESGAFISVPIPNDLLADQSTGVGDLGLRISSSTDVVINVVNSDTDTCGSMKIFPIDAFGDDYYVLSYWPEQSGRKRFSQFGIVAVEDDTEVTVSVPAGRGISITYNTDDVLNENNPATVTLNRFQTFYVVAKDYTDLTGSHVTASKKVGVFSGNRHVKTNDGNVNSDHLVEQMPPTLSWGTMFSVAPFPLQTTSYYINFIAKEDDTHILIGGRSYGPLNAGESRSEAFELLSGTYAFVTSDNPIMLGLYVDSQESGDPGGPSMLVVPPSEQYKNEYSFVVPEGSTDPYTYYLSLTVLDGEQDGLLIDSSSMDGVVWNAVLASDPALIMAWVSITTAGLHHISHGEGKVFGAYMYGHDEKGCGFATVAGMCLDDVSHVCILGI